ncbi:glycoside hydrolase family 16 protein [Rhodotorula graminis WP1]|uniref:Glycoside hydrolase family 16 protein n=1 Tax=Rhodotorula graminis (strain WP1) TaxID=578459 RepID=A0A0P9IW82_RHOGW|nr:glycoside hydrolase family 16 protein [Rhodotorula graminis WP1]KPV74079.1 glycoside hydrolase family 16 protein [Rhodotorula graminis WP1]
MPATPPSPRARASRLSCAASLAALVALASSTQQVHAAYSLTKDYSGSTFFDGWDFYGNYDNLTNGDIIYVKQSDSADLAYVSGSSVILKMDNVSEVPYNEKRRSVRIETQASYGIGSLWTFDFAHVPYGCSVWPAAWATTKTWPQGGEIDTFEGVNLVETNQMAMHTADGCSVSNGTSDNFSGTLTYGNCFAKANDNSGCTIRDTRPASYGAAFAAAGGGVWATQLAKDGVSIWFFPRSDVPSDLSSGSSTPSPDAWGTPAAYYPASSCATPDFFSPQNLVITMTACGDWAGNAAVMNSTGCPLTKDSCYLSYVLDNTNFDTAYFDINSIRVFYDPDRAADSAPATTATASSSLLSVSATPTSSPSGSSGSSSGDSAAGMLRVQGAATALVGAAVLGAAGLILV